MFTNIHSQFIGPVWIAMAFACSLFVSYIIFPTIIYLSHQKGLMDCPNTRSSHLIQTPTLGGVGIFAGMVSALVLYCSVFDSLYFAPVFGALVILFFLGIKDDILILAPTTKFAGQSIAVLLVILATDLRILSFEGIFGLHTLNYAQSIIFTYFVFVLIINSFNLIDGIDGLAASIALAFASFSGFYFLVIGHDLLAAVAFALVGTLVAFLKFNLSQSRKIFMGDTGSMIVGFLMAFLSIHILNTSVTGSERTFINMPIILISLFSYPLLDTFRIFVVRVFLLKKNPFLADHNHIHHCLLNLGLKHWQATLIISVSTILVLLFNLAFDGLEINLHLVLTFFIATIIYLLPFIVYKIIFKNDTINYRQVQ